MYSTIRAKCYSNRWINKMEENIISVGDRVRNNIYDSFLKLKRQYSLVLMARSRRKKILALRYFRIKYSNFFLDIFNLDNYGRQPLKIRDSMEYFIEDLNRINTKTLLDVMIVSSEFIRHIKLTKITYIKDDRSF